MDKHTRLEDSGDHLSGKAILAGLRGNPGLETGRNSFPSGFAAKNVIALLLARQ